MGYLKATLHTDRLRGSVGRGITVETNDPAAPRLFLTIRAVIAGSVLVLPQENLSFSNLSPRQHRPRVLVRRDPTETGELSVRDIKPSAEWFTATATRLEQPAPAGDGLPAAEPGDWLIEVALTGTQRYGVSRESLSFTTGLPRQPEVTFPVIFNLRPPVQLSPERVELAPGEAGQGSGATVLFSVRPGLDPAELRVEAEPEGLKVELEPAGRRFYKAKLSWNGERFDGGAIVFSLGAERYRVPVSEAAPRPAGG